MAYDKIKREFINSIYYKKVSTKSKSVEKITYLLLKIINKRNYQGFCKVKQYVSHKEVQKRQIKKILSIFNHVQEKNLLKAWSKIINNSSAEVKDVQHELNEMIKQVDNLKKQIAK